MKILALLLALFMVQGAMADTLIYSEDFEGDAEGAIVRPDWTLGGVPGSGSVTVAASTIATGQTKSLVVDDTLNLAGTGSLQIGVTSTALASANSGAGVKKGRVELDFQPTGSTSTLSGGSFYFRLYDDYPYPGGVLSVTDLATTLAVARSTSTTSPVFQANFEDAGVITSTAEWAQDTDYHLVIDFDTDTRDVSLSVNGTLFEASGKFQAAIADGFTGIKGIAIETQAARLKTIQVDNIKVYEVSTVPAPEVAVTVDAANVADGGTVDFGAPAVGVPTSKTFTVSNTGTADLTTANLVLPAGYTLASGSTLAATITPSSSDDFIVELDTATEGIKDGEITFETNDSDENPFNISVTADVGSTSVEEWTER